MAHSSFEASSAHSSVRQAMGGARTSTYGGKTAKPPLASVEGSGTKIVPTLLRGPSRIEPRCPVGEKLHVVAGAGSSLPSLEGRST